MARGLHRNRARNCLMMLVVGSLTASAALARPKKAPPPPPVTVVVERPWPLPPAVKIEKFQLDNGLRVIVQSDPKAPLVAVGLMVDVGSRDEQPGRTGLAHFFEHLMFEGSAHVAKMEHVQRLEAQGAEVNANTSTDRTWYYEIVPKSALEVALWLEAERLQHLKIEASAVDNQRQAVLAERSERMENRPYGMAFLELPKLAFTTPALQHPTIGEVADVRDAPLQAFQDFWKTWYSPNNCVIVLVGDVTPETARTLVGKYFGPVTRRAEPVHTPIVEQESGHHAYQQLSEKLAKTPGFHLAWKVPAAPEPDSYALDLLAEILGGGDASRLQRRLTQDKALATSVEVSGWDRRTWDLWDVQVHMAQGSAAAMVEAKKAIRLEIQDIIAKGPTEAELRRAKVAFESAYVFGGLSAGRRAELLAEFELSAGDAHKIDQWLPSYRAVTAADVSRAARRWLSWNREIELDSLPVGMAKTGNSGQKPDYVTRSEQALIKTDAQAKLAAERATAEAEHAQAINAAREKALVDKAVSDKAAIDKAVADKATADKAAADKAMADKAAADKAAADKVAADKAAADKAAADKAAADLRAKPVEGPVVIPMPPVAAPSAVGLPGAASKDKDEVELKPLRKVDKSKKSKEKGGGQ